MSSRDGLWKPDLPDFLADQDAVELLFVKSLREPEPEMTENGRPLDNAQLAAALVRARSEIAAIGKDRINPHFKSAYATMDAILESVMPILNRNGLTVMQGCVVPDSDSNGNVKAFTVRTTLLHVSGESLDRDIVMPLDKSDPQGAGRSITYGRRYGLSALLCLATEDDDDGNASRGAKQQRTERKPNGQPPIKPAVGTPKGPGAQLMPVGKHKGQTLESLDEATLLGALKWMNENNPTRYATAIEAIESVLEERRLATENRELQRELEKKHGTIADWNTDGQLAR